MAACLRCQAKPNPHIRWQPLPQVFDPRRISCEFAVCTTFGSALLPRQLSVQSAARQTWRRLFLGPRPPYGMVVSGPAVLLAAFRDGVAHQPHHAHQHCRYR